MLINVDAILFDVSHTPHNFYLIVTRAAKINYDGRNTNFTLTDHIWCYFRVSTFHNPGILIYSISDHFPIFYFFKFRFVNIVKKLVLGILMKKTKKNLFMKYQT